MQLFDDKYEILWNGIDAGKVIFMITTDGIENSSHEFTYEKIKELIKHQQEKFNWEFIFLGANIDAKKEAASIGIDGSISKEINIIHEKYRDKNRFIKDKVNYVKYMKKHLVYFQYEV
jgi:hypothetical protein